MIAHPCPVCGETSGCVRGEDDERVLHETIRVGLARILELEKENERLKRELRSRDWKASNYGDG